MPVLERTTRELDGKVVSSSERRLFTLAELKDGKQLEGKGDVVENRVAGAFDRACDNISQMMGESGWISDSIEMEISEYIVPEILGKAGITTDPKTIEWDVNPVQSGMFFALNPASTKIDAAVFLRAMKGWFAGKDWRGREYAASEQKPRFPYKRKVIDLRSSDAWHARRAGVYMQIVRNSMWSEELDIEPGYDYEHEFSEQFMVDCNEFISEITGFALRTLRDTAEGETEEESLLEAAEANGWMFTETGAWA